MTGTMQDIQLLNLLGYSIAHGQGKLIVGHVTETIAPKTQNVKGKSGKKKQQRVRPASIRIAVPDIVVEVIKRAAQGEGGPPPLVLVGFVTAEAIERHQSRIVRPSDVQPVPPVGIVRP